jgi:Acetyltransferase (GNAT) family
MRYGMRTLIDLLTGSRSVLSPVPPAVSPLGTQIRAYRPADKDACVEIYNENETGRFPDGVVGQFEQFLQSPGYLRLVGCIDEQPIAIGGIGLIPGLFADSVWLVFGMVRPALHRRGIGTAMLLARLAALPRPAKPVRVSLTSVEASEGFFERFGLAYQGQMAVPASSKRLDVKSAILDSAGWDTCRTLIHGMGIETTGLRPVPTLNVRKSTQRRPARGTIQR